MKKILLLLAVGLSFSLQAQEEEEDTELYIKTEEEQPVKEKPHSKELGFDLHFGASQFSGTAGLGLKYGFFLKKNLIAGPSVRFQRSWYNINGIKGGYAIYGGGAFIHQRFYNYFFAGAEFELLSTPFNYTNPAVGRTWAPTFLVGGGFSRSFTPSFRVNAGIMYDIINHANSPFRVGYTMKKENGQYIPVIYRLAFFITLD